MSRIAYVNGRYVPHREAAVHVEDRGYQFADGVYEVIAVVGGKLIDEEPHIDRLGYSLSEIEIDWPVPAAALKAIFREVVRRNRVVDGIVYLQVSRGEAWRDHAFPADPTPAIVVTARSQAPKAAPRLQGVRVITAEDERWKRVDIKTVGLLPNVLAKEAAVRAGAYECWMIDGNGMVTEGTATNAWMVTAEKELITREPSHSILNGITRMTVLDIAKSANYKIVQRPFSLEEALAAPETFLTSTTSWVVPIIKIDDTQIGSGAPGELTRHLQEKYDSYTAAL
jgi:D-alanine transaminase